MIIETERLNIYPISNAEMEILISKEPVPELKIAYQEMLNGCIKYPKQRIWYALWNIELKDKTVVGNLSFKGLQEDGVLEIGYGMNSQYLCQGIMTEAVTAVVKWASTQENVKVIEAETEESNFASKRVLEKSGFIPNGIIGEEGPRYVWKG